MTDPLQALQSLLRPPTLQQTAFPPTSRYCGIPTATLDDRTGRALVYVRRRMLPDPAALTTLLYYVVVEGDRLDNLAARYLGDPEQYWRLCDANGAMRPDELTDTIGRRLRITLPAGLSGGSGA